MTIPTFSERSSDVKLIGGLTRAATSMCTCWCSHTHVPVIVAELQNPDGLEG